MSWIRKGDEWNSAPEWGRALEIALHRNDVRLVNELKGASDALFTFSAQQWTDYKVRFGEAAMVIGTETAKQVIADLVAIGVLFQTDQAGLEFQLLERENFVHIIRSDDKKKAAKRKRDQNRGSLQVPVLLRDGDNCRYCGDLVIWNDTRSDAGRELDHRNIQEETTPDNYVVACKGCNQLRYELGDTADDELPLLDPPEFPVYGQELIKKLSKWPRLVAREAAKRGIRNPLTAGNVEASPDPQPAGERPTPHPRPSSTPSQSPDAHQRSGELPLPGNSQPAPARSSGQVAVKGRAGLKDTTASASQPHEPNNQTTDHSQEPRDSQPREHPQTPPGTHVRAPGSANGVTEPARKRSRNRRSRRRG
ncbi:hypothetical protein WG936_08140 [Corynebacterium sp. H127]|uniref:HNH endonuclease n=1 Tax=Corynebacterium sp. H127 TaxID=3133418 RepID=UPI0030AA56ED